MIGRKTSRSRRQHRTLGFERCEPRLVLSSDQLLDAFPVEPNPCEEPLLCEEGESGGNVDAGGDGGTSDSEAAPCNSNSSNTCPPTFVVEGSLPRHVQVIDAATGQEVFEGDINRHEFPVGFLPLGNYIVKHAAAGEVVLSLALAKTPMAAMTSSTSLTFEGAVPRRIQIINPQTDQVLWDYWHYGSDLDVVGLFPVGDYIVKHASSGERWNTGSLRIGADLPSFRLYAEHDVGDSLLVDWGTTGTHSSVHLRVTNPDTVLVDEDVSDTRRKFDTGIEFANIEVNVLNQPAQVIQVGDPPTKSLEIALPGTMPRHVQIFDTTTGEKVYEGDQTVREFDTSVLDPGHYLLRHSATGESNKSLSVAINENTVLANSTSLTFDGSVPRRVKVTNNVTGQKVWDYWIYSASLDVVGLFPVGEYTVEHSSPNEPWQKGLLRIGVDLPSYRLYAEHKPGQSLLVDWGTLGLNATTHVRVTEWDSVIIMDADHGVTRVQLNTTAVNPKIEVNAPGQPKQTMTLGEPPIASHTVNLSGVLPRHVEIIDTTTGLEVFAGDRTTRSFDVSFLPPGHYLLRHGASGETPKSLSVAIGKSEVNIADANITLEGTLPRRVRIRNADTLQTLWDYWVYSPTLNVIGLFPQGRYTLDHAASSEPWVRGEFEIGVNIPSYRLHTERRGTEVYADWGTLGYYDNFHVRALQNGTPIYDQVVRSAQVTITAPEGAILWEIIPQETPPVVRTIRLPGPFPRHVEILDTLSGKTILEFEQLSPETDISNLAAGHYMVMHAAAGEYLHALSLAIDAEHVETSEPGVTFPGTLPRRLRIVNTQTNAVVWDYYIYGNTLPVVGLFPPGTYATQHSSGGSPWIKGTLQIGAQLPSYRLYTEQVASDSIRVDWGDMGLLPSVNLEVLADGMTVVDEDYYDRAVTLQVPQALITVNVTALNSAEASVEFCTMATLAPDGTCRNLDVAMSVSQVAGSMYGFALRSPTGDDDTAQFSITEPPRHGALTAGNSARFQTYRPDQGFIGRDTFGYRVVDGNGVSYTKTIVIDVVAPVNPERAYFVPGLGTINRDYRTPDEATLQGAATLPYSVIVNSDFARLIERIDVDGTTAWRHTQPFPGRTVSVLGDEVVYAAYEEIRFVDAATGKLNRSLDIGLAPTDIIHFVNPIDAEHMLLSWFDPQDNSYVGMWNVTNQSWDWQSTETYLWPRWADKSGDLIIIADTYGHRVVGESMSTHDVLFEVPGVYPNEARFIPNDTNSGSNQLILIVEEHSNRIWKYDWITGSRSLVISAPGELTNVYLPIDMALAISFDSDMRIDPLSLTSKSKASVEYSGVQTLYSPNGAIQLLDGSYYVADTDNHRVVHVSPTGEILAELIGLNDPTKIAAIIP